MERREFFKMVTVAGAGVAAGGVLSATDAGAAGKLASAEPGGIEAP